jgi:multisubunit Na+/H+ antiporter MnhC subunit
MIPYGVPLFYLLITAVFLYAVGFYIMATKRNMIKFIIGLELLLDGAHLNFVTFATAWSGFVVDPLAQSLVIISICIGGGVIAVGLAFIIRAYNLRGTLDIRKLNELRH